MVTQKLRKKLGRRDASAHVLFTDAFDLEPPQPGRPRLRLAENDGGDTYANLHAGAMSFAKGCYLAVRNPATHEVLPDLPEHEALEQLAAFSLLARWVDTAKVETADA
jgi:hypothetical protein